MIQNYLSAVPELGLLAVLACLLLMPGQHSSAQTAPVAETRGVWFATVLRDGGWPRFPTDPAATQEADLRARIREAWQLGLNTFVFQAVARGDAMYPSARLPWSVRLGGAGQDPGYDPLAVAIDECHRLGMELHAWINTYRVGDLSTVTAFENVTGPGHVYYENAGWVGTHNGELWLDPSSADAREWLVANVMEIVSGYDVDAVHFDFIRYPSGGLTDDLASFQFDPRGFALIEDWRRDNVTLFVNDISAAIYGVKPWVKVGSAPFGNYIAFPGAWPAAWAYSDVFQESRKWLADGTHDYVAPQIYFDIGTAPEPPNTYPSPDFAYLVDDWVTNASNRPVFVGHGPYKPVVFEELDAQIARARTGGAGGQIFFRFDNIRGFDFQSSYPTRSLPYPMVHRFELSTPSTVTGVTAGAEAIGSDSTRITIDWLPSAGSDSDPLRGYAVFAALDRDPVVTSGEDLWTYVREGQDGYAEVVSNMIAASRRYAVVALSRLGGRANPSAVVSATPVGVQEYASADEAGPALRMTAVWPQPAASMVNFQVEAFRDTEAIASIVDMTGRTRDVRRVRLSRYSSTTETLDVSGLSSGIYLLVVRAGTEKRTERLIVVQ